MKPILIALALARALDVASTCDALHRHATEGNPLVPFGTCPAVIGFEVGIGSAQTVALWQYHKAHPKIAKVIAIASLVFEGWVVQHNLRVHR